MVDLITLAQAGPAAILLVGIVMLFRAFVTGSIVPGYLYKATSERRDTAEKRVVELTKTLSDLAKVAANGKPANGKPADAGSPSHE